jgi:hypothetical protein
VIDGVLTLGYANQHDAWKLSRSLRPIRKTVAYWTGMHGFVSGKGRGATGATQDDAGTTGEQKVALRNRLAAIERARGSVARVEKEEVRHQQRRPFWRRGNGKDRDIYADGAAFVHNRQAWEQDKLRRQRLAEIDQLQESYGQTLAVLAN